MKLPWFKFAPAAVVGACAVFASVQAYSAGDFAFAPPSGWNKIENGTNMKWVDQSRQEYVILHPTTFNGSLAQFVNAMLKKEKGQYPTQHVWANKNYYICGRHTGRYVIWTSTGRGQTAVWEQMLAVWGEDGYAVTYVRPQSHPPSNIARASLLSICGIGESLQPSGGAPVGGSNTNNQPAAGWQPQGVELDAPSPAPTGTISHPYMPVIPDGG
jgi:hypothetical protein